MTTITSYKCPSCGAAIAYDSSSNNLTCEYCNSSFEISTLEEYSKLTSTSDESSYQWEDEQSSEQWTEEEKEKFSSYLCQSCGGEIVTDETTAATRCPYCDSITIVNNKLSGELKPELIVPFKINKEAAEKALKEFYKNKKLLPDLFRSKNRIESITGIYVPFWIFSCGTKAALSYDGTRIRTWSDSKYNYTETSHYLISRKGTLSFEAIPIDGSKKMDDDFMESIEPYNLKDAVEFSTAYLSGYFADRYDVDSESSRKRVNERVENSTLEVFSSTVYGYNSVVPKSRSIQVIDGSVKYGLLPVWLLNTKYNGELYTFAMNGQTGKFVGKLPIDKKKYFIWLIGLTVTIGIILTLLLFMIF
ncbi:MAG: hypothetical protein ACI33K_12765 [Clostridiaceae bacterium]